MTMLAPELLGRAQALESMGFRVVHTEPWHFLAVRSKWHWDLATHLTMILRVRRVQRLTRQDAVEGQASLRVVGDRWDPCKIPRGFQHGRLLADVIIADAADPDAVSYARTTVGKAFGGSVHTAIVPATGGETIAAVPLWGRAFWPKMFAAIQVAASGRPGPEPAGAVGLVLALLMYPSFVALLFGCCGIPPLIFVVLLLMEKPLPSALAAPPAGPAYR